MHSFFRHLHLRECQLDELWTFVAKKEAHLTPLEKLATIYGDAWVWIAFSPVYKLVPAWVVGKRTLRDARRLVLRLQAATDGGTCHSSPATPCRTMPTLCWRCMVSVTPHHGKGPVGVCPNPAATRHPTCATRWSSKSARMGG
jgi:hypothetical protein